MRSSTLFRLIAVIILAVVCIGLLTFAVVRIADNHAGDNGGMTADDKSKSQSNKGSPDSQKPPESGGTKSTNDNSSASGSASSPQSAAQPKSATGQPSTEALSKTGPADTFVLVLVAIIFGTVVAHLYQTATHRPAQ